MSESQARRSLPLIDHVGGGRSRATCRFRCGDACFHDAPNTSDNPYFGDIVTTMLSRRSALRAGAVTAGVAAVGLGGIGTAVADPGNSQGRHRNPRLDFDAVAPNTEDDIVLPDGYEYSVLVRWGDPILHGAPEFDFENQTAEAQAQQFGYNCDYVGFVPLNRNRGLLFVNHEYTNDAIMFAGYTDGGEADLEQIRIAMAAHGGSVVEIKRVRNTGGWELAPGRRRRNRRITADTPMRLTGPAAGHELLRTEADPDGSEVLGMLNNCAGGMTPWGTFLSCEENFHQYFSNADEVPADAREALARYGLPGGLNDRRWDRVDERFDLAKHPNEANRFGYVVEIDPTDPDYVPRKRTMLGRFKHEACNSRVTDDGRVAFYMGDDERFDYIYKFVTEGKYLRGGRPCTKGEADSLLDSGTLYVARLTGNSPEDEIDGSGELPSDGAFDGVGEWIPLCSDTESYVDGFSVAEVLVHTRLAADTVGPTKMDRPEDFEASPTTGKVYCALTNNTAREPGQADEPNPRGPNRFGHILEITEAGGDAAATEFTWDLPIICGDPEDPDTYFAGFDKSKVSPISAPDNVAFDPRGNLWISTDGQPGTLEANDALHAVPVEGEYKGELKTFATVPRGAECCGPFITEDGKTVFLAPQHPGDGGTYDDPQSNWPDREGFPRPSVATVWHVEGKTVGA